MVTSFKGAENGKLQGPSVGRWSAKEQSCLRTQSGTKSKETCWLGLLEGERIGTIAYVEKAP